MISKTNILRKIRIEIIKDNIVQIAAITEKDLQLSFRYKYSIIFGFITPIISILMPLIVMNQFLSNNLYFGGWTQENFFLYQFIAYNIFLLRRIIDQFPGHLFNEKFWKTLPALLIAPFNRFNLLMGIFIANIILISVPFSIVIIICFIISPVKLITLLFTILIYFLIALVFSGIGLLLGIFAISNENILTLLSFCLGIIFWASCVTFPFELFPDIIQFFINLNPLYYLFDLLRKIWIENNLITSMINHPYHFIILFFCSIIFPLLGIYTFNYIFKKYGIMGY